jgi:hemerythrin-like metal-binding protein
MAYIDWDEKYSVQIQSLDVQHKMLFDMINGFYAALKDKSRDDTLQALLDGLLKYTAVHFTHEEALMKRGNYPGLAVQQAAHAAFVQKVKDVQKKHTEGKLVLSVEITGFLKSWLTEHILSSDSGYADCLSAAGAA